jgi:hypothetical protein
MESRTAMAGSPLSEKADRPMTGLSDTHNCRLKPRPFQFSHKKIPADSTGGHSFGLSVDSSAKEVFHRIIDVAFLF